MLSATKSLTEQSIDKFQKHIDRQWVASPEASFVQKHVLARGAHLLLAPASLITTAIDTIVGMGAGVTLALYQNKKTLDFIVQQTNESSRLLFLPYQNFLQAINPEAEFTKNIKEKYGPISAPAITTLTSFAKECSKSENFFQRHVASRLTYALAALASLVTKVVEGIISIPIVAASIVTLGNFTFINDLAYRTLIASSLITDTFVIFPILVINPRINQVS
jgi:hypothetical protein